MCDLILKTSFENPQTIVRPYTGAVGPVFLLMHDNAQPHMASVYRQLLDDKDIDATD